MIRFLGYDESNQVLRVQFNKRVYDYHLVPRDVGTQAEPMLAGGDQGWFHRVIKGTYPFTVAA